MKLSRVEERAMSAVSISNARIDLLHNYRFSLSSEFDPAMKQLRARGLIRPCRVEDNRQFYGLTKDGIKYLESTKQWQNK